MMSHPYMFSTHQWYISAIIQPFLVANTFTLGGKVSELFIRRPSFPPLSFKIINAGSFSPEPLAARATVNSFFVAFVVPILTVLQPTVWLVLLGGMSILNIVTI